MRDEFRNQKWGDLDPGDKARMILLGLLLFIGIPMSIGAALSLLFW